MDLVENLSTATRKFGESEGGHQKVVDNLRRISRMTQEPEIRQLAIDALANLGRTVEGRKAKAQEAPPH
jgi:hypothetical protein